MRVRVYWGVIILLAVIAVGLSAILVFVAQSRPLTPLEGILFQVVILAAGLAASYMVGKNAAKEAARGIIRPHARSAFRRVYNLYASLFRLSTRIEVLNDQNPDQRLELIRALVDEQFATGRDALEDWRDIIPEDVDEMERRYTDNDNPSRTNPW